MVQWLRPFGWGDLAVVPFAQRPRLGEGLTRAAGPELEARRLARPRQRPALGRRHHLSAEIAAMSSGTSGMANVADLVEQGLFKREYRDHRLEWMIKSGGLDVVPQGASNAANIRFTAGVRVAGATSRRLAGEVARALFTGIF